MNREPDYNLAHEPAVADDIGTVRVDEKFGTVAIYIKVAEGNWQAVYVDPIRRQYLVPSKVMGDVVAGTASHVVYAPKPVV